MFQELFAREDSSRMGDEPRQEIELDAGEIDRRVTPLGGMAIDIEREHAKAHD